VVQASTPTEPDFAALLRFRTALRRFNRWSEDQAAAVGLTHIQHQLLLAVKGHDDARGPTIGEVAEYLLVRQHSVVELATRVEALGFVQRRTDGSDGRVVRLTLTPPGEEAIHALTELHLRELQALAPLLQALADAGPRAEIASAQDHFQLPAFAPRPDVTGHPL
jgi:DNA-binding MarR family transcriptional regulator